MSGSLRPGSSTLRRAASVMLVAGWTHPSAAARSPPPAEGFRLLLLQRASNQGFMPNAHVFPGGMLDAADRSSDWLRLFAPHQGPPRFGLGPDSLGRASFPVVPDVRPDEDPAAMPDDVALRICAIREAFEEAGVLLLRPRGPRSNQGSEALKPGRTLEPPPGLADWRASVHSDPRRFLHLCAHLDCTPDIWALHDWNVWITPNSPQFRRRFDTAFYLCCLSEPPLIYPDLSEVVHSQWSSPSEATRSFISKDIWLAPPQFYELKRLENFTSLSDLHTFCLDRASEGVERWMPVLLYAADGHFELLPGDELYLEDSDFLEKTLSTEKKIEEVMKEGRKFHRILVYDRYLYHIHVTIPPKFKHVYPKNYVASKSHL